MKLNKRKLIIVVFLLRISYKTILDRKLFFVGAGCCGSCTRFRKTLFRKCTPSQMDTIPNGHNPEWAQSQMDTIPDGHNPEYTTSRKFNIPKVQHPERTPSRMDTITNGHHPVWTPSRMSSYIYTVTWV